MGYRKIVSAIVVAVVMASTSLSAALAEVGDPFLPFALKAKPSTLLAPGVIDQVTVVNRKVMITPEMGRTEDVPLNFLGLFNNEATVFNNGASETVNSNSSSDWGCATATIKFTAKMSEAEWTLGGASTTTTTCNVTTSCMNMSAAPLFTPTGDVAVRSIGVETVNVCTSNAAYSAADLRRVQRYIEQNALLRRELRKRGLEPSDVVGLVIRDGRVQIYTAPNGYPGHPDTQTASVQRPINTALPDPTPYVASNGASETQNSNGSLGEDWSACATATVKYTDAAGGEVITTIDCNGATTSTNSGRAPIQAAALSSAPATIEVSNEVLDETSVPQVASTDPRVCPVALSAIAKVKVTRTKGKGKGVRIVAGKASTTFRWAMPQVAGVARTELVLVGRGSTRVINVKGEQSLFLRLAAASYNWAVVFYDSNGNVLCQSGTQKFNMLKRLSSKKPVKKGRTTTLVNSGTPTTFTGSLVTSSDGPGAVQIVQLGQYVIVLFQSPYGGFRNLDVASNDFDTSAYPLPPGYAGVIIHGNDNKNVLIGTSSDDVIYGYGASDDIDGGDGNDTLHGGNEACGDAGQSICNNGEARLGDVLKGGNGNDTIYGGNETCTGTECNMSANLGDDIDGGAGADTINGGNETCTGLRCSEFGKVGDTIIGGDGNDTINGGDEACHGESCGNSNNSRIGDHIEGGAGNDTVNGGSESCTGLNCSDPVVHPQGDIIHGDEGDDVLNGQGGDDTLDGSDGTDTLDGGSGTDDCDGEGETNCET